MAEAATEAAGVIAAVRARLFEPADAVVDSWPVSNNPPFIVGVLVLYWMFVYKVGPQLMKDRDPIDPRRLIQLYNVGQVVACLAMVVWLVGYAWWYLMIKLVDLLDTVFFVLRRKTSQVTFLHVYHHMSVVLLTLLYVRFTFSEHIPILAFLNSLVHVFMYAYYFLAALGPEMQKRLWWKRYITRGQLVQFVILFAIHATTLVRDCPVNKTTSWITLFYVSGFLYLFGQFYVRTYLDKSAKKAQKSS